MCTLYLPQALRNSATFHSAQFRPLRQRSVPQLRGAGPSQSAIHIILILLIRRPTTRRRQRRPHRDDANRRRFGRRTASPIARRQQPGTARHSPLATGGHTDAQAVVTPPPTTAQRCGDANCRRWRLCDDDDTNDDLSFATTCHSDANAVRTKPSPTTAAAKYRNDVVRFGRCAQPLLDRRPPRQHDTNDYRSLATTCHTDANAALINPSADADADTDADVDRNASGGHATHDTGRIVRSPAGHHQPPAQSVAHDRSSSIIVHHLRPNTVDDVDR